ncbi:hypothetical protein AWB78_08302 [Caballeronia calidae]|uniref:Uncharacterized protein n=1 Tax=Caballeronia calidae TaxID=1777139 RepID=A0A158EJI9_9BURK|nr:hypothetical protein [Caballeronia calidae]SAL06890.1 hypothetical protein AWB78_08302 [Caballeronia calidae]
MKIYKAWQLLHPSEALSIENSIKYLNKKTSPALLPLKTSRNNRTLDRHSRGFLSIAKHNFSSAFNKHRSAGYKVHGLILLKTFHAPSFKTSINKTSDGHVSTSLIVSNGGANPPLFPGDSTIGHIVKDEAELLKRTKNIAPYDLGRPEFTEVGWCATRDVEQLSPDTPATKQEVLNCIKAGTYPQHVVEEGIGEDRQYGTYNELRVEKGYFEAQANEVVVLEGSAPHEFAQLKMGSKVLEMFSGKTKTQSKKLILVPKIGISVLANREEYEADLKQLLLETYAVHPTTKTKSRV